MFIGEKGNGIFFYHSPITLSCEYTNHTADSQLKINNVWYDNVKKDVMNLYEHQTTAGTWITHSYTLTLTQTPLM